MQKSVVRTAEEIIRKRQRRSRWRQLGALALLVVALGWFILPKLHAIDQAQRAARAEAKAQAAAKNEAQRQYYARPSWERIPQYSLEETTAFAQEFLAWLGYALQGELVYTDWTTTDAWGGSHKQYHYYALIDPAWPPIRLRCGPSGYYELGPLTCYVFPRGE